MCEAIMKYEMKIKNKSEKKHDKNNIKLYVLLCSFYAAIIFYCQSVLALPSDENQPIQIQADKAEFNEKNGTAIYTGDVKIKQGTLKVIADVVTIYRNANGVETIVAVGKPAHYRQKPEENKADVFAHAKTIEYHVQKEIIKLIDDAKLEQEGNTFTGQKIDYFMKKQLVKANSQQKNGRVFTTILPDKKPSVMNNQ